ncbi:hypothetical protein [Aurantiacibacter sp. MUD61]|uniref:hypothetical protein n=1 Tax=Aurantiacibacter sp. MUD61 TaxID=3009083 RepID=UPI0022F01452|nr:hypothetical protein [Aurantiacibacter sp. MUD61]
MDILLLIVGILCIIVAGALIPILVVGSLFKKMEHGSKRGGIIGNFLFVGLLMGFGIFLVSSH